MTIDVDCFEQYEALRYLHKLLSKIGISKNALCALNSYEKELSDSYAPCDYCSEFRDECRCNDYRMDWDEYDYDRDTDDTDNDPKLP